MKRLYFLAVAIAIVFSSNAQTVRRVTNISGVTGTNVYTTLQAAHDAAAANDIIMVEPSAVAYGDLTLTKPLKIYGNGYYLNTNTELKADQRPSTLGYIYFNTGSGGSLVAGISGSYFYIQGVSNVTVTRCYVSYVYIYNTNKTGTTNTNVTGTSITANEVTAVSFSATTGYTISGSLISNNILGYVSANDDDVQSVVMKNNTLTYSLVNTSIRNSIFENNLAFNGGVPNFTNVTASYNISSTASFSGGIGNQNNYDIQSDFIGTGTGISPDEKYQLIAGSPLKTAGSAGSETGAFGTTTPYIVSGIPAIPSIVSMVNSATGTTSTPLQVTISIKANN